MRLYKQIREDNRKKYGTEAEKVLKIIINQYSDRTHFIYEILQNAEDAGATYIKFHLEKRQLLIFHNGRPFNEKDIEGVCGIASGTKEDGTRIGHFGIGFKSVYCYTERPEIYSGSYHFVIKDQLFPEEIAARRELSFDETCMILPFDKEEVPDNIAYQEIRDALVRKINAESILMLNSIDDVEIEIENYPEFITINKAKFPIGKGGFERNVFSLSLHTTIRNRNTGKVRSQDADYLFFTNDEKEAASIIFRVDGKELVPVKNSRIYAFFPTAKEAHQNFYIHAPFDTTPARDNFKEGAEYGKHNLELIQAIGSLIWFAFQWLRDNRYLSVSGLNAVFPIYEYEENDVLYSLYQNSIEIIREEAILPTNREGEFKNINDIIVPQWEVIVDVFHDDDLRRLRRSHSVSWLAKECTREAYRDFRKFLNKNFQMVTLDWKDLVLQMDAGYLQQKELSWFSLLTSRIESFCVNKDSGKSRFINVSGIPFVRTARGEQICARDESGKLQVYLNNPDIAHYKIEGSFLKDRNIRDFYQRALDIPEYNIVQEAIENILPKYETRTVKFQTNQPFRENIADLKIIKDAVTANPSVLGRLKDKYIVTDGSGWYRPEELYIKSDDVRSGYSLVKGIIKIRYLSESYLISSMASMNLDEAFFKKIGCNAGIRKTEANSSEYLQAVRHYKDSRVERDLRGSIFQKNYMSTKLNWAFNYEGFPQVFADITQEKSIRIARFLSAHTDDRDFDVSGEIVGADDQHFSGKNVDSRMAYSMLGLQICFEKWLYVKGDPNPHRPDEIEEENLLDGYKAARRLLRMLPFKEVESAFTDWLNDSLKDQGDLALVKHYFPSPEEMLKTAKAMAKSEANAEARKKKSRSVKESIEQGDKAQKKSPISEEFEMSPISEKGKKKREEKLDQEFAASMDHFIHVSRGLSFSRRSSNEEERAFLEQEYDGHCQICLKQINKHDGQHYFEAINIIKYSEMPDRLRNSSKYGWNSLCLCPNCAAEYNYCSKKISTLYDQVMQQEVKPDSDEPVQIFVEIPLGKRRTIYYSPRHFIALKEALKIFADET